MEIYSIYSNYSIPSKRKKKKGLVGSIAQDYTVRGNYQPIKDVKENVLPSFTSL